MATISNEVLLAMRGVPIAEEARNKRNKRGQARIVEHEVQACCDYEQKKNVCLAPFLTGLQVDRVVTLGAREARTMYTSTDDV